MTDQPPMHPSDPQAALGGTMFGSRERLLPLRQMGIGELIDAAFKLYRRDWLALMGIVAFVLVPVSFIDSWVSQTIFTSALESVEDFDAVTGQLLRITLIFGAIQFLIVQPFLLAAITRAAADAYLGEPVSIGRTYRFALSRLLAILWISIISTVLIVLGFIALVIPGIVVAVRLALAPAIFVVEDVRGRGAVKRSWALTGGHAWRVFGTLILSGLISTVGAVVVTFPTQFVAAMMGPDGWFVATLGQVASEVLITPFSVLIVVLLYFDLRVRKEGFDIEVMARELAPTS